MTRLGIEDSGKRVTLDIGDTILVNLPGKEGPGYGWVLTPGDPRVIDTTDGSTFVAKGGGTTRLVFAYRHPWENRAPIKTVTFDIQVGRRSYWLMAGVGVAAAVAGGIVYASTRRKRRAK